MDWANERFVRVYTRDSGDWLALTWDAQSLLLQLLRKVDRAGVLELGKQGKKTVAIVLHQVALWDSRISPALEELLKDGCIEQRGDALVVPNFLAAQEAIQSDRHRQAESRARRREMAQAGEIVTRPATAVTPRDSSVTPGHAVSRGVTPSFLPSDPSDPKDGEQAEFALTPSEPPEVSPVTRLRRAFVGWYQEAYGEPPKWVGKDAGIAADLLALGDVDAVMAKVRGAAAEKWRERRVTLGVVLAAWNEIVPAAATKPREPTLLELHSSGVVR